MLEKGRPEKVASFFFFFFIPNHSFHGNTLDAASFPEVIEKDEPNVGILYTFFTSSIGLAKRNCSINKQMYFPRPGYCG